MANVMITGASSGIGLATALELGRAGHTVFATMRSPVRAPQLGEIATRERLPIKICTLDVDSDDSVRVCFAGIGEPIDALVNNAGVERHGCIEELPMEAFLATMNTNYFGAVRCIKAILPRMREARKGCIVNVSSVSGRIANSPLGAYSASKFALEAISEALAGEVKPFNIDRKSTRLNSSHLGISYAVFCLKKKKKHKYNSKVAEHHLVTLQGHNALAMH